MLETYTKDNSIAPAKKDIAKCRKKENEQIEKREST